MSEKTSEEPAPQQEKPYGKTVEQEVRWIAAKLGLPDFVYTVPLVSTGSNGATREVGDALLIANGRGAVVQVKSREPDLPAKGETWLESNAKKARDQGSGSRRKITFAQQAGAPLTAIPVRAADLSHEQQAAAGLVLDADVSDWPTIVVFDNDAVNGLGAAGRLDILDHAGRLAKPPVGRPVRDLRPRLRAPRAGREGEGAARTRISSLRRCR